ncbi:SDR family NAD(P)-dependent oxidoreductase [Myxococcota bacterium]|nr:SDR family NAD(P)-dependent oxidoreductase [Myxococcota bacterium]
MDLGLKGKTTIVTGASGVIGRGLVQRFTEEGSSVILATRDGKKGAEIAALFHGKTGDAICIPTDVTNQASVQAMVDEMLEREAGSIVNITSNSGLLGEAANLFAH